MNQKKTVAASKIWEAPTLREMQGECDLCARECFPDAEICVSLACGYRHCTSVIYHQACLEKYLKRGGLEGNRKTGFPCPRGRGKCTKFAEPCRGKIERSHPIINRNPTKQAKKAVPVEVIQALGKGKPQPAAKPQPEPAKKPDKKRPALVLGPRIPNTMPGPSSAGVQPTAWRPSHGTRICLAPRTPVPEDDASVYSEHTDYSAEHQDTYQDTGGGLIPGMEALLTKAQKKNLARRAKKQAAQDSQSGRGSDDRSELSFGAPGGMDVGRVDSSSGGGHGSTADGNEWPGTDDADAGDAPKEANPLVMGTGSWVTDPDAYSRLIASMGGASDDEEEVEQMSLADAAAAAPAAVVAAGGVVAEQAVVAVEQLALAAVEPDAAAIERENAAMEAAIKASLAEAAARAEAEAAAMQMYQQQAQQRQQEQERQQQAALQAQFAVPVPVPVPIPQPVTAHIPNVPVPTPLPVLPAYAGNGYGFAGKEQYPQAPANHYANGYGYSKGGYGAVEEQAGEGSDEEDFDSLLALCGVGA